MKKSLTLLSALTIGLVVSAAVMAASGVNFFQAIEAEYVSIQNRLGVGTTSPSASYVADVVGAVRVTGVPTIVGSPVITGSPAVTGNPTVIGSVAVSTSASSSVVLSFKGFTVTLSTRPVSKGEVWGRTTDNTLWMSTAIPAHNDATYASTAAYIQLSN